MLILGTKVPQSLSFVEYFHCIFLGGYFTVIYNVY
jgi:hypothetical protein